MSAVQGRMWLEWLDGGGELRRLTNVSSARMTRTLGVRPSVCAVTAPYVPGMPRIVTQAWKYGNVVYRMHNCAVVKPSARIEDGQTITLQILDSRWDWMNGHISGRYNVRQPDGTIDANTEANAVLLASLLFEAMNVTDFDLSDLPDDTRPEVEWDFAQPADELDKLLNALNCDIAPMLDGSFRVVRLGTGAALPAAGKSSAAQGQTGDPRPARVKSVGAPIEFQERFALEAVGLDTDGVWKPLDQLSYYPTDGFTSTHGFQQIEDEVARNLAKRSVFRCYRIREFAAGDWTLPDEWGEILSPRQIELEDGLIEWETIDGERRRKRPEVRGTWYDEQGSYEEVTNQLFVGPFSIDQGRRMVRFSSAVYRQIAEGAFSPASLYLDCAFHAQEPEKEYTGLPIRYTLAEEVPNADSSLDRVYEHDDLTLRMRVPYTDLTTRGAVVSNLTEVRAMADAYNARHLAELAPDQQDEAIYPGIMWQELDGAIQTVRWQVGAPKAQTVITRNGEPAHLPGKRTRRERLAANKAAYDAARAEKRSAWLARHWRAR